MRYKIIVNKLCECGCGKEVTNEKNRYINGHNGLEKRNKKLLRLSLEIPKLCKCGCGQQTKIHRDKGIYNDFIRSHALKCLEVQEKVKNTNIERYGGVAPMCSLKIQEKAKNTLHDKTGYDYVFQNPATIQKSQSSCNLKFHTDNPMKVKEIRERGEKTREEIYGHKYPLQCLDIYQNFVKTCQTNMNVENPSQSDEVKKKKIITSLKNNGTENPSQCKEILEKKKQTSINNCGEDHWTKTPQGKQIWREILEKLKQTNIDQGNWIPDNQISLFNLYRRKVDHYTYISVLKKFTKEELKTRKRGENHIDHKFSIQQGFINDIVPWIIGSMSNLKILSEKENLQKHNACSITKEELFQLYEQELIKGLEDF